MTAVQTSARRGALTGGTARRRAPSGLWIYVLLTLGIVLMVGPFLWLLLGSLKPQAVYGYFPVNSEGDDLIVWDPEAYQSKGELVEAGRFAFPRQPDGFQDMRRLGRAGTARRACRRTDTRHIQREQYWLAVHTRDAEMDIVRQTMLPAAIDANIRY